MGRTGCRRRGCLRLRCRGSRVPWPSHWGCASHGLRLRCRGCRVPWPGHWGCSSHGLLLWRRGKSPVWLDGSGCSVRTHGRCAAVARSGRWCARSAPLLAGGSALIGSDVLPVSLGVIPVAAPVLPAAIDDNVCRFNVDVPRGGVLPISRHPGPLISAPVPVAADPVVVRARRHGDELSLRRRRRARNEDRRLILHDHRGLRLGRRWLVVDRLRFGWRRSDRDRGTNHAASQSQARNGKGQKPGCGSGHVYLSGIRRIRLDLYSPDRKC